MRYRFILTVLIFSFWSKGMNLHAQQELPIEAQADTLMVEETGPSEPEAIEESTYTPPDMTPLPLRNARSGAWEEATDGLDYSRDQPEPPKTRQPQGTFDAADWNLNTAGLGKFLQVLAVAVVLIGIAIWVYRLMQAPKNRKIAHDGTLITAENIEAYIHETDLERFLREALAAGNYPLAIRLYYLQIIKSLSEKGAIRWSKEKTNRDYLREMRDHHLAKSFREATRHYEKVWYGNQTIDAQRFTGLEPEFRQILNQL